MKKQLYIIDGYNMIGAWPNLRTLKDGNELEAARDELLRVCSNFQKFEDIETWVVFDAQLVPGVQQTFSKYQVKVIFTSQDETADQYIERIVAENNTRLVQVSVATSDLAQQWIVFQKGALRKSAREFYQEIERSKKKQRNLSKVYGVYGRRRRSPWSDEQYALLDQLRHTL